MIIGNTYSPDLDIRISTSDIEDRVDIFDSILRSINKVIEFKDVFVVYNDDNFDANISEKKLTKFSLALSESSFSEYWENEDDEYWDSF